MKAAKMLERLEAEGDALAAAATALLEATSPGRPIAHPDLQHLRGDLAIARDNWNKRLWRRIDGTQ
jgi:hypothetical protein